ncbi:hypothetical protein EV652_105175 [Kribbella steppae]|uniref:Uncharacterized protein n=1 Tax=Kribbella steppae TaxID=2512223 RepID=A0A4R2HNK5_9ACTN|nr:hypothetical protein [Kribbella steppae]TCO30181.1 hypothetical protein EV652_105175 [Kribbella steppae]
MVPMGPIEFSPAEVAMILTVLALVGVCSALPATIPLALVGHRRGVQNPGWNALWYWLCGTVLTVVLMGALIQTGLGWAVVPLSWLPTLLIAWLLKPRHPRPGGELGWSDMTSGQQGER